jgi:hypothetical protein
MSITNLWVGAVSPVSARVVGKITGASATLLVADNQALSDATPFGPVTATPQGIVSIEATGLTANTRYWYALDDGARSDTGTFRTHPPLGSEASFTLAVSSCAGAGGPVDVEGDVLDPLNVSNHPVFQTLRDRAINEDWIGFAHVGDLHYYNIGVDHPADLTTYRRSYDDVLVQSRQQRLYRDVPLIYMWDDHDFGPNNSDSTAAGRLLAQQVYRERVPHATLSAADRTAEGTSSPIYHSFTIGRVLFIVSDTRSSRTPNSATDDASKTMLGANQKTWMRDVLSTSSAEFFCWLNPTPWLEGGGSDTWSGFLTEANELVQMFTDTGWLNRMCVIGGDTHYLGLDTGTGVSIGGVPLALFGSLDSSSSGSSLPWDTGPVSAGKDRYGTFDVRDDGSEITVTLTGWVGAELWRSHSITVSAGDDGGGGGGSRPDVGVALARQSVTWLGCDLVSGQIIAELPDIQGSVSRVLGAYTSHGLKMPIPIGGPGSFSWQGQSLAHIWEQATVPGQTMIVPVVNDVPAAAFIVLTRKGGTGAELQLGTVSLEGYLSRRYVGDHTWTQQDEASVIAAGLAADAQTEGIGLIVDAPATGTLRDRAYQHTDDGTVYQRLTELMEIQGGPEWTIDVDWADDTRRAVVKILRVRKRIGTASDAVFSTEGSSEARYEHTESYEDGKGANHIIATSSGEGEDRPESSVIDDVLTGWPRWERRFSPSSSIKNTGVLIDHAIAELGRRRDGATTWEITTRWGAYPRLGVDWRLGDDVAFELTGHRHPFGVTSTERVIGWELDTQAGTVKPILLEVS